MSELTSEFMVGIYCTHFMLTFHDALMDEGRLIYDVKVRIRFLHNSVL